MNLQYHSNLPTQPPRPAQVDFTQVPVHGFGTTFADNMRSMGSANQAAYDRGADQAGFNYDVARMQGQQGLALSGLQNMAEEQNRDSQLQTGRLQNLVGALRNLL
jgi:hypothetical protein